MARLTSFYTLWLLLVVVVVVVGWLGLTIRPVHANVFTAYQSYMPGEDADALLTNGACTSQFYEASYGPETYLLCMLNDAVIDSAVVSLTGDSRVEGVSFFLKQCTINAGDLALWYDADIAAVHHGMRLITWSGGQASSWDSRYLFWTPKTCLKSVWFENDSGALDKW